MENKDYTNYQRIAKAIQYLQLNFKTQPNLEEIAEEVNLSPFHFQRLFSDWAGVSPKKFLQYLNIKYAKEQLLQNYTLSETSFNAGLTGTSRLHDLFIKIEGMTPGEFKNQGKNLTINYSFDQCKFGDILIASTPKGICHLSFVEKRDPAIIQKDFPNAEIFQKTDYLQKNTLKIFEQDLNDSQIKLHLKGTPFQLKVWEALLNIPFGKLTTYGKLAKKIDNPNASRAVGTAIGKNPVAFLIPCHRVIQSSGHVGGYMWGPTRKAALIGWEASNSNNRR